MYDARFKNIGILVVMPVLVDECGNTAVCKARDRVAVSHGEMADNVQVLVGCGASTEPAVVRDVHHEA